MFYVPGRRHLPARTLLPHPKHRNNEFCTCQFNFVFFTILWLHPLELFFSKVQHVFTFCSPVAIATDVQCSGIIALLFGRVLLPSPVFQRAMWCHASGISQELSSSNKRDLLYCTFNAILMG